jgi:uncharacterized protein
MNIEKLKHFIFNKLSAELSPQLTYHGVHHTIAVYKNCEDYINRMNISEHDVFLLLTGALLHDTGFLFYYDNHEDHSMKFATEILPEWNYKPREIDIVNGMIRATKIPQQPTNILEQIIGDSDLDYLGTDDFYPVSQTLYDELIAYNKISNETEWDQLQIRFLQKHSYHTPFALQYREPVKQKHLHELIEKQVQ